VTVAPVSTCGRELHGGWWWPIGLMANFIFFTESIRNILDTTTFGLCGGWSGTDTAPPPPAQVFRSSPVSTTPPLPPHSLFHLTATDKT
jgi:hypothetical protein